MVEASTEANNHQTLCPRASLNPYELKKGTLPFRLSTQIPTKHPLTSLVVPSRTSWCPGDQWVPLLLLRQHAGGTSASGKDAGKYILLNKIVNSR